MVPEVTHSAPYSLGPQRSCGRQRAEERFFFAIITQEGPSMDKKTVVIAVRTTPAHHLLVKAVAAMEGKTVSQLIDEAIVQKAVRRLLPAAAEVVDEQS